MLNTKFHRNLPTNSGEEDFLRVFMGVAVILVM